MKKLFAIIVTIAVVVCGAVPAMAAYFDNNNLMMVVYNRTDNEVAIDLGDYKTVDFSIPGQTLAAAGSVNPAGAQFGGSVDSWDDLHVGLFVGYRQEPTSGPYTLVIGTTKNEATAINPGARANFITQTSSTHNNFRPQNAQVATGSASAIYSYTRLMDNGAYGQMAGFNPVNFPLSGPDLSVILTQGYIDLYLYEYTIVGQTVPLVPGNGVDYQGIIRLSADGSITTAPAVVPIPGALVLLASGLVGLVGIRRKNS